MKLDNSFRILLLGCFLLGGAFRLPAQEIVADPNPQLFTVLAAINAAGYDTGLNAETQRPDPVPLRVAVRQELAARTIPSRAALQEFYRSHRHSDPAQDLSQYVSLALYLSAPPALELPKSQGNLPPEVLDLQEMVPLLAAFYREADIAGLWGKYLPAMEEEADGYRKLLARVIQESNAYLRLDTSGYFNRRFAIYVSPLGAPDQTDARSYGDNYFIVVGPSVEAAEEEIRHGWLHYLLDPFPFRHARVIDSKAELHRNAARAPALETAFRSNFSLLLTESLIRAIQARRMRGDPQARQRAAQAAVEEGFYLAAYFFNAMEEFEKQPVGMRLYYSEMIDAIPLKQEQERLAKVRFRAQISGVRREFQWNPLEQMTRQGEASLARGEFEEARQSFEAVSQQFGPQGRALYGLAIVASQQKQPERAKEYFSQAASLASDPRTKAWSHIYLGRLLDLEGNRQGAVSEYAAALESGDPSPDTRAAAEKGLQEGFIPPGFVPPAGSEPQQQNSRQRVPLGREGK
ncbi:MAG: hypothetical protein A3H28_07630 [Acidobacteria bacterium RIFCSPLOWO2_02_FULL_61_28]|nr:MAG: hypothetical protein A3H28_07630 [Acidobacteria bacterium RIFCSPLOWO2_02_FULL_61_28]